MKWCFEVTSPYFDASMHYERMGRRSDDQEDIEDMVADVADEAAGDFLASSGAQISATELYDSMEIRVSCKEA